MLIDASNLLLFCVDDRNNAVMLYCDSFMENLATTECAATMWIICHVESFEF